MIQSAHNKRLITEAFNELAIGDGRRFVELLDENVTMLVTGDYSWSRTFTGKSSVLRDLYGAVGALCPGVRRTTPIRILADDDWVVVEARGDMTTRDGKPYRNHYCLMYRLCEGKIVEMREYQDSAMCERVLGPFPERREP